MSQSLSKIYIHIVFSTKNRKPILTNQIQKELFPYVATVLRDHQSNAYKVGGFTDHIHIACSLSKTQSATELINIIKTTSSKWLKQRFPELPDFSWQHGYGVFSFGQSGLQAVMKYIENQEEHHTQQSFKKELIALLNKYDIEYEEQYL